MGQNEQTIHVVQCTCHTMEILKAARENNPRKMRTHTTSMVTVRIITDTNETSKTLAVRNRAGCPLAINSIIIKMIPSKKQPFLMRRSPF